MLRGIDWSFIHIPKCGGMALRNHLTGVESGGFLPLGHECAVRSPLHRIPEIRPPGRVFTVIRHPASWLRSYWLDQSPQRIVVHRFLHQFWSDDLNEFITNVCTGRPGYVTALYKAHMMYQPIKVFRLEDGLDHVMEWLGIDHREISVVNGSSQGPHLSSQSTALINLTEGSVLRQFGYAS